MSDFIEKCIGMFIVLMLSCFSVVVAAFTVRVVWVNLAALFQ